ncbi:MAG: GAF domain-containing sensor histidine kinase [Chloroflexi bacterium]|nr:GAF domain-containing sensor histidine kinase [Chloroflexota bacterium]
MLAPVYLPLAERVQLAREHRLIPALLRTTAAVASARPLEEVLRTLLDTCAHELDCLYPCLTLLEVRGGRLRGRLLCSPHTSEALRSAGGVAPSPEPISYRLDRTENLVAQVYLEGSALVTPRYYDLVRPDLQAEVAAAAQQALGIGSIALLPLLAGGKCLGVLAVAAAPAQPIGDADLSVLGLFAGQAAIMIENARLHQDLRDREQQVSFLLKATIDAQEEERERICLEIHDGVAQTLAPAFHYLQALDNRPGLEEPVRVNIRKASALVRNAIREAREVIATLRPAALDTLGLVATLRYELDELREQTGQVVAFDADPIRFPKAVETALYRIVHEAVTNATKHAHACRVMVRVKQDQDRIVAEIQDDGVGFDLAAWDQQRLRKGVGLLSMRKRAEVLQGSFDVTSSPGEGTRVRVEVPLRA